MLAAAPCRVALPLFSVLTGFGTYMAAGRWFICGGDDAMCGGTADGHACWQWFMCAFVNVLPGTHHPSMPRNPTHGAVAH
eukprot:1089864-Rhodomonas_salina.1